MKALRIVDWEKHYETAESRRIVKLQWVATPNGHDSMGYCDLMDHENGLAHFGVWNLLLQVASKCPARGLLVAGRGPTTRIYTPRSIAVLCRCQENVVAEAIARLVSIGWLEEIDYDVPQPSAGSAQRSAGPATTTGQDRTGQDRTGQDRTGAGAATVETPFDAGEPEQATDADRWRMEATLPWGRSLKSEGAKIGPNNWTAWKRLVERHTLDAVVATVRATDPEERWPDKAEKNLTQSRGQAPLSAAIASKVRKL